MKARRREPGKEFGEKESGMWFCEVESGLVARAWWGMSGEKESGVVAGDGWREPVWVGFGEKESFWIGFGICISWYKSLFSFGTASVKNGFPNVYFLIICFVLS